MTDLQSWLTLLHSQGLGSRGIQSLLQPGYDLETIARQAQKKYTVNWSGVEQDLRWLEQSEQHHIIPPDSAHYPSSLKALPDAPILLFLIGSIEALSSPQIAIVGSRNASAGGRQNAFDFAHYLASIGLSITSGLALGIDGAAHQGALAAQGQTIAVLATGLDRIYPSQHQALAEQIIAQGGALVSESPIGTQPKPYLFPVRNRLISGLSLGVLVVEASLKSGSLSTARRAIEQNKEVFAIPGSIHNPLSKGCHQLIKQGAKLVENAEDILDELAPQLQTYIQESPSETPILDQDYQQLLDAIGYDAVSIETLVARTGFSVGELSSMLLWLELENYIVAESGGRYSRRPA